MSERHQSTLSNGDSHDSCIAKLTFGSDNGQNDSAREFWRDMGHEKDVGLENAQQSLGNPMDLKSPSEIQSWYVEYTIITLFKRLMNCAGSF